MPQYTFRNKETGQSITLEGDREPTESELDYFFAQQKAPEAAKPLPTPAAAPAPTAAPETPKRGERGIGTTIRELGTEAGAATAGQMLGTAVAPGIGTMVGGAAGGGIGNLINQFQRMSEDPGYKFKWGEFMSDVGLGAIPGGSLAKTGGKALLREAAKQGAAGLGAATVQKIADEGKLPTAKEALLATAVPAAGGAIAQKVLSQAPSSIAAVRKALAGRDQELKTFEQGALGGLKVVPSDINPSFAITQLESVGGKAAVSQRIQLANQKPVNDMVKAELGVPKNVELSPSVTRAIRNEEGDVYKQVDKLSLDARDELEKLQAMRAETSRISDPTEAAVAEAEFDKIHGAREAMLKEKAAANLEDLRRLRAEMEDSWKAYFSSGGNAIDAKTKALTLKTQADELEKGIDATLRRTGHADLADRITTARQRIAKTYDVDEMMNPGNFNIDPDVALRKLKSGDPLSGNLLTIARFKAAFPNSLRESSKVSNPDVSLLGTFAQGAVGAGAGIATGNIPAAIGGALAVPLARKGARELLLSTPMQLHSYEAALPKAIPSLGVGAAEAATRQTSQQAGQGSVRKPVPPAGAIELLKKNPSLAKSFDEKYGVGSARRYLK